MEAGKVPPVPLQSVQDAIDNSKKHESANPGVKRIMDNLAAPTVMDAASFGYLSQLVTQTIGATVKHALQAATFTPQEFRNEAMKNMTKMNPPTYDGTGEPMAAYHWLNRMESLLTVIACPDHLKEEVASSYLMDEASDWWDLERPNVDFVPWSIFRAKFEGHYFRMHVSDVKRKEFLYPDNEGLAVTQLSDKFNELVKYAGPLVQTEEDKIKYFHGWMRPELRSLMAHHCCTTLYEYVFEACKVETAYEKMSLAINTRRRQGENPLGIQKRSAPNDKSGKSLQLKRTKKALVQHADIKCHNCGDPSHRKPECIKPLRTCRGCGKSGHMVEVCRAKGRKEKEALVQHADIKCHNCGDPSHRKPECIKPLRTCRRCGKSGHMVEVCRAKARKEKEAFKEAFESFTGRSLSHGGVM